MAAEEESAGAFTGVRVVELAQWVFVPVAGALLADWGADVVRIERPEGDPYRGLMTQGIGAERGGVNLSIALANRGKRSVALDLRTEGGREILEKLIASADVFLTNFRPGALQRLGLDAETLTERYPALIYLRGHGYGARWARRRRTGLRRVRVLEAQRWALAHVLHAEERARPSDQPARRDGRPQRRDGAGLRHGGCAARAHPHGEGQGRRRVVALHRDVDAVVRRPVRVAGRQAARDVDERERLREPARRRVLHQGRPPHLARVPRGRSLLARLLPADRAGRAHRGSALRRPRGSQGARRRVRRDHHRRVQVSDVRGVEGVALHPRRAVGAGAGGRGAARRPAGDRQRLHRRGRQRRRSVVPAAVGAGAVRRGWPRAAARARARRALGADPARARLLVGRHRAVPISMARAIP